jgi:segregation and condensation protein B
MTPHHRLIEAVLFASPDPVPDEGLTARLPPDVPLRPILADLAGWYEGRGIGLVRVAGGWAFRTAADLAPQLADLRQEVRRLSRAAIETMAIIAYHQPVTRAEIESIRGVATNKGTLDTLIETGWIAPGRRREAPGRPVTWVTTTAFLDHFGLAAIEDLPNVEDLKASGLLDLRPVVSVLPGGRLDDAVERDAEDDRDEDA